MQFRISFALSILTLIFITNEVESCFPRQLGDSVVCVCNSTHCDNERLEFSADSISVFTTSKDGRRLEQEELQFNTQADESTNIEDDSDKLDPSHLLITLHEGQHEQTLTGFGGALTDAASLNILSLSSGAQQNLLESYFGPGSSNYNMIRVPMAGCDFSTRAYTYLDTRDDYNLTTFALADEDVNYKIPLLERIKAISEEKDLRIFASPWTAPSWMKTNQKPTGLGKLKGLAGEKYSKTWASYFVKFIQAYEAAGVKIWGITTQNEPSMGTYIRCKWQELGWTSDKHRDFIKTDLGPALRDNGLDDVKVIALDDSRPFLRSWADKLFGDPETNDFVDGLGLHWYWNTFLWPASIQRAVHNKYPDKFLLPTEACNINNNKVLLGDWESGVKYSTDIMENLNNWAVGWVDWNLCLDEQGGPNWVGNYVDSPIIVNTTSDEFYKQPMYYHLQHFSRFLQNGAVRVITETNGVNTNLMIFTGKNPDNRLVLVAINPTEDGIQATVANGDKRFEIEVPGNSIQTYTWMGLDPSEIVETPNPKRKWWKRLKRWWD